jgi:hypothetical protein
MRLDCTPVTLVRAYPEDSAKQFDFGRIPRAKKLVLANDQENMGAGISASKLFQAF